MALVVVFIVVIALWPPRTGAMLMVPLSGHIGAVVDVAMAGKAGLVATGPLPGSMIVIGDRAALAGAAFGHGILLFSAPRTLCGDRAVGGVA